MPQQSTFWVLLSALSLLWNTSQAISTLKQVHVVTRHGSGYFDDAIYDLTTHNRILTPYGQEQVYELGRWLRDEYGDSLLASYDIDYVELYSSRTSTGIVSAQILAQAMFENTSSNNTSSLPASVQVPILTRDDDNDVTIRAYRNCDLQFKEVLYRSDEWQDLQNSHIELLRTLGGFPQFQDYWEMGSGDDKHGDGDGEFVPLEYLYNIFDAIYVAKQECDHANATTDPSTNVSTAACPKPVSDVARLLKDDEWIELQEAAHAAEMTKYDTDTAGKLVGGNLWKEILDRAKEVNNKTHGFYLYSAHYETLLGMFAALEQDPPDKQAIPNYASALLVEVYYDDEEESTEVKLLYKPGGDDQANAVEIKKCESKCSAKFLSDSFSDLSMARWCHQCGNEGANVCLQELLDKAQAELGKAKDNCNATTSTPTNTTTTTTTVASSSSPKVVAGSVFLGILLGLLLAGMSWCLWCRGGRGGRDVDHAASKGLDLERSESPTDNTISPSSSEDQDLTDVPIHGGPYVYA